MTIMADRVARQEVLPPAPTTLEQAGLGFDLVMQLVLKLLHFAGRLTGIDVASKVGLPFSAVEGVLEFLTREHQVSIEGGALLGRPSYRYRITDAGRNRAALFLETNQYIGVAPVPVNDYRRYMRHFEESLGEGATRDEVRQAFAHLVLSDRTLDKLGPAINARHSMFVYGPPGNGKSVISQAIQKLLPGEIAIPHAIEVEGNIIRLFNPVVHETVSQEDDAPALHSGNLVDRRWVACRRPLVTVGGELALESLDLCYKPSLGFYHMPVQVVANGGVLVIDDFGRQRCSPQELLNRWIVPLETRVDFLTLQTGQKFDLPFVVLVVFATNLRPVELADEAFLRRIQYKIFAQSPTVEEFIRIFEKCCRDQDVPFDRSVVEDMLARYYRPRKVQLRGCQPRDLISQALSMGRYLDQPRRLTPELLEAACDSYFVDDEETSAVYA